MDSIILSLKSIENWKSKFQFYNELNQITGNSCTRLQDKNTQNLRVYIRKLIQEKDEKFKTYWVSSEYQVLEITLNSLSTLKEKKVQAFDNQEWQVIESIFPYKDPMTIRYETKRITKSKTQFRRKWCVQEEKLLLEIVTKLRRKNKWNQVARQLYIKSNGLFFRQGKHCRQRWLHFIQPSLQNKNWTLKEDFKIMSFVLKKGKKWTKLAKIFSFQISQPIIKKRFCQLIDIQQTQPISQRNLKEKINKKYQVLLDKINSQNNIKNDQIGRIHQNIATQNLRSNEKKENQNNQLFKIQEIHEQCQQRRKQMIVQRNQNLTYDYFLFKLYEGVNQGIPFLQQYWNSNSFMQYGNIYDQVCNQPYVPGNQVMMNNQAMFFYPQNIYQESLPSLHSNYEAWKYSLF